MDGFYGDSGAGSGAWKIFKLSGTAGIDLAPVEGWPKGPSVHLRGTNAAFDAGIRQTVAVTPGLGYHFNLAWAVETIDGKGWQDGYQINRRLGIDPFGGTDANSPNVQWSSDYYGSGKFALAFDTYAQTSQMTVFVRVTNPYTDHVVDVYLDTAGLNVNSGMAPITVSAPVPAQPPPTSVPQTARPTRAPTTIAEAPTATEVPTEVSAPTDSPVAEAVTETPQPSDTLEPSATATKLPTRSRRATPTPTVTEDTGTRTQALLVIGATGLLGIGLAGGFFGLAMFYWLRSKGP